MTPLIFEFFYFFLSVGGDFVYIEGYKNMAVQVSPALAAVKFASVGGRREKNYGGVLCRPGHGLKIYLTTMPHSFESTSIRLAMGMFFSVAYAAYSADRQRKLKSFTDWLDSGGANLGKLRPVWRSGEGYTVVSTTDILEGESMAFVPDNLFIGPKAASQSNLSPLISHLPAPEQVSRNPMFFVDQIPLFSIVTFVIGVYFLFRLNCC